MAEMMKRAKEIVFRLRRVAETPKKEYRRRGSKYAPILDRFMEGEHDIVEVEVENIDPNRLRLNLVRVIEERGLEDWVNASVVNRVLYLEKVRNHK